MKFMNTEIVKCCPICEGTIFHELLRIDRPDRFELYAGVQVAGYMRRWMECLSCGAAINVHPEGVVEKLELIAKGYYEVDLSGTSVAQKYHQVMSLPAISSDNAGRVARIGAFLTDWRLRVARTTPTYRVVDIGAGKGVFLSKFILEEANLNRSWHGLAFEPDALAAAHLRELKMFDVQQGLFSENLAVRDVNLCTLNKVIEHLPYPVDLIRQASTVLIPDSGVLYVEVPAKETIFCRQSSDNILGALHHHLYDFASLDAALRAAGMIALRLERIYEPSGKISIVGFAVRPEAANILRAVGNS